MKKHAKKSKISEDKLKNDFYSFQSKINKLEEIKREINFLESKGLTRDFEKEAALIKSRLKDTNSVNQITKQFGDLREMIFKKHLVKKQSPVKKIEKKVENIESTIEDTSEQLRKEMKNIKFKINESDKKKEKTDSGTVLAIYEGFQNFLQELKLDLSQKVKNKEKELNEDLQKEISIRRRELEVEYKDIERKLEEEYQKKKEELEMKYHEEVDADLHREVRKRFSIELRKRFEEERAKFDYNYVSKIKQKYHQEFERQKKLLEEKSKKHFTTEISRYKERIKKEEDGIRISFAGNLKRIGNQKLALEKRLKEKLNRADFEKSKEHESLTKEMDYLEKQKHNNQKIFELKLAELDKQKRDEKTQAEKFKQKLKKELSEKAHNEIISSFNNYRKEVSAEMKAKFNLRLASMLTEQGDKQKREFEKRVESLNRAFVHEQKINTTLKENLSEKKYELEQNKQKIIQLAVNQRERNRGLILAQSKIKHEEMLNHQREHSILMQKHKNEIESLTEKLKKAFGERFDNELKNHVINEKQKLEKEFEEKRRKLSGELNKGSLRERIMLRKRMKNEFNERLARAVQLKEREIHNSVKRDFVSRAKEAVEEQEKKLKSKLNELNEKYKSRANAIALKEKSVLESERARALDISEEKRKLADRFSIFRKSEEEKLKNERLKIQKEFAERAHNQMIEEIKAREQIIRKNLEKSFEERIKLYKQEEDRKMEVKKAELAKELQKRAQALLG